MPGIDEAADAFSSDMNGGKSTRTVDTSSSPETLGIDDVFGGRQGRHTHENDEVAGGDDLPDDEAVPEKTRKPAKAEDDEEEDPLYADEPEEKGDKEEDGEDEKEEEDDEKGEALDLDPDALVTVTIDGEEREVKLSEALDGFIRIETFHKRLNEVSEAKGVLRAEASKLIQDRSTAIELLDTLETDLKALMPDEPNWDEAFAKDADGARALQKQFGVFKEKLAGIRAERSKQQTLLAQDNVEFTKNFATSERAKFEQAKENQHWQSDPKKKDKDLAAMVRTAKSVGFSNAEISGTLDSRMLTILLRASKYDRMTANKPKLAPRGVKPTKPGAGKSARQITARRGVSRAQQQLAKSGRVDDAAAVFQQLLR